MFGLVETALMPPRPAWGRLWAALTRADACTVVRARLWGADVARARVTYTLADGPLRAAAAANRRRADRALAALTRAAVTGVVLPDGFPDGDLLPRHGLRAWTPAPLCRRLADRLTVLAADMLRVEAARLRVAIVAARVTTEVAGAAAALCGGGRARFLSVSAGRGGAALCRTLRSRFGVAALADPTPEQLAETDVYLVFEAPAGGVRLPVRAGAAVLLLGGGRVHIPPERLVVRGAVFLPPVRLTADWPPGFDDGALLAALAEAGALSPAEVRIRRLLPASGETGAVPGMQF
ncbi:MAG: hypothetical protein LBK75_05390 [Oscillospiraceae bacterium]|jgi:hypothetical protein|nr:hypothetical protein [Oscillospiraceae bacterium]